MTREDNIAVNEQWDKDALQPSYALLRTIIDHKSSSPSEVTRTYRLRQLVLETIIGSNPYAAKSKMTAADVIALVKKYVDIYKRVQTECPNLSQGRIMQFMGGYKWREDTPDAYAEAKLRMARVFDVFTPTYEELQDDARREREANTLATLRNQKAKEETPMAKQPQSPVTPADVKDAFADTPHPDADADDLSFIDKASPVKTPPIVQTEPVTPHWSESQTNVDKFVVALKKAAKEECGIDEHEMLSDLTASVSNDNWTTFETPKALKEAVIAALKKQVPSEPSKQQEPPKPVPAQPKASTPVNKPNTRTSMPDPKEWNLDADGVRARYTVNLKGKFYLQVGGRILLFRLEHKTGRIETDVVQMSDNAVIFKATIIDSNGNVLSTGHGCANLDKSQNYSGRIVEKAETAAIGRALAHAGFGTDEVDETEGDDNHLADSPVQR